jgi:hypothetical protein
MLNINYLFFKALVDNGMHTFNVNSYIPAPKLDLSHHLAQILVSSPFFAFHTTPAHRQHML